MIFVVISRLMYVNVLVWFFYMPYKYVCMECHLNSWWHFPGAADHYVICVATTALLIEFKVASIFDSVICQTYN